MVQVILGIGKGAAMIAGGILFVFFLLLFCILFCPFHYRIRAERTEKNEELSLTLSWLFRIAVICLEKEKEKPPQAAIRLFGFYLPVGSKRKKTADDAEKAENAGKAENVKKAEATGRTETAEKMDITGGTEAAEETDAAAKTSAAREADAGKEAEKTENTEDAETDKGCSEDEECPGEKREKEHKEEKWKRKNPAHSSSFQKRRVKDQKTEKLQEWRNKAKKAGRWILEKPAHLLEFARQYELAALLGEGHEDLKYLFRHFRPRSIQGWLTVGAQDPALSAELTGMIYFLLPADSERFTITTKFSELVLEGEVQMQGKIRCFHFLRIVWIRFRDKRFRKLLKVWKTGRLEQEME